MWHRGCPDPVPLARRFHAIEVGGPGRYEMTGQVHWITPAIVFGGGIAIILLMFFLTRVSKKG